ARADAAKREPLRGRVRDEARGAPEEAEARHLPEEVVDGLAGRVLDVVARENRHARRRVAGLLLHAGHRDHDRFEAGRVVGRLRRGRGRRDEAEEQRREPPWMAASPLAPIAQPPGPKAPGEIPVDKIKVPAGFKVALWASGINNARVMTWGDRGTLFVSSRVAGNVYAVLDKGSTREVKV